MKTIEVSDEDYETLMSLSKELQLQDNHCQAFPYFWEPSSEKLVPNVNDEGEEVLIYDYDIGESFSPSSYAEANETLWAGFVKEFRDNEEERDYEDDDETDWVEYIRDNAESVRIFTQDWERSTEHNPSLFLSDVQSFLTANAHHLGRDPKTYARTIWRMPKMEALVAAIYRLNKQPTEAVNREAARFVFVDEARNRN